jgi:hypothetical protein
MGYIEETGAAQYARDARITTIYEGTTSIQANDFVGRKIVRDEGDAAFLRAKIATARHFGDHVLVQARGLGDTVVVGRPPFSRSPTTRSDALALRRLAPINAVNAHANRSHAAPIVGSRRSQDWRSWRREQQRVAPQDAGSLSGCCRTRVRAQSVNRPQAPARRVRPALSFCAPMAGCERPPRVVGAILCGSCPQRITACHLTSRPGAIESGQ